MGPLNILRVGAAVPFVLAFGPELVFFLVFDFWCSAMAPDSFSPAGLMAFASQVDPGMVPEGHPERAIERSYKSSQPLGFAILISVTPVIIPCSFAVHFFGGCSLEVSAAHTPTLTLQLWRGRGRRRQPNSCVYLAACPESEDTTIFADGYSMALVYTITGHLGLAVSCPYVAFYTGPSPSQPSERRAQEFFMLLMVFTVMVTGSCLANFIPNPRSVLLQHIGHSAWAIFVFVRHSSTEAR